MQSKCSQITGLLADTWWYGLSKRLPEREFKKLALLRKKQGFSAIQLVVGIPPEVGPENENTKSDVGFPWNPKGEFNLKYLELAGKRIKYLNELGFKVIVYGAWGYQIKWLGVKKMTEWWLKIIEKLDSLNVIYCLSGEIDLWVGEENKLLNSKTTDDLFFNKNVISRYKTSVFLKFFVKNARKTVGFFCKNQAIKRKKEWSLVLEKISRETQKPIIVHTTPNQTGYESVFNYKILSANTVQTGHGYESKNLLWRLPLNFLKTHPNKCFINLEPWYEGIKNKFWLKEQLYAYWVSVLVGVSSYCYGAHGVWNVGDGKFLSHWGERIFEEAIKSDIPRLIGLSHKEYLAINLWQGETHCKTKDNNLISIRRENNQNFIQFFPEINNAKHIPKGKIWLPLEGIFTEILPKKGQAVIFGRR